MTTPVASVVTPVYNAGPRLDEAVACVARQTFTGWEHVIVDDGSTDLPTRRALDRAAAQPGVVVHRTENRGPAAARNVAIEHARGAYVLPLDADDTLAPTFLARTCAALDGSPEVGVVHTWVGLVGGHTGTWRTGPFAIPALLARCTLHVSALYRRELWVNAGGYDPAFQERGEDWDFWIRLAAAGAIAREVPEALAFYRRTTGGREDAARAPGVSAAVMRRLATKHRRLYEAHVPEVAAALFEEVTQLAGGLERIYGNPVVRAAVWARRLAGRSA